MGKNKESVGHLAARSVYSIFIAGAVALLFTVMTSVFVPRLLSTHDYGLYTLAIGFFTLLTAMNHFGIGTYLNKHLAEMKYKNDYSEMMPSLMNSYVLVSAIAILLSGIGMLLSGFVSVYIFNSTGVSYVSFAIAAAAVLFYMLYGTSYAALVGLGMGNKAAISSISTNVVAFALSISLILMGFGVNGALFGFLAGYAAGFATSFIMLYVEASKYIKIRIIRPENKYLKRIFAFALPVALNNILTTNSMNGVAVLLLGIYSTTYVIGNFGVSLNVLAIMTILAGVITTVMLPSLSASLISKRTRKERKKLYDKALIYALLIVVPIVIVLSVFSKQIVYMLISSNYALAPEYITLIGIGFIVSLFALFTSSFLVASGKPFMVLKFSAVSTIMELLSLFLLVPRFSAIGAIISIFFVGNLIDVVLFLGSIKKDFGIAPDFRSMGNILVCSAIIGILMYASLLSQNVLVETATALFSLVFIYPVLLVLFKILNNEKFAELRHITKNIPLLEHATNYIIMYLELFIEMFDIEV